MLMYQTVKLNTKPQKISNPFVRSLQVIHGTIPQAVAHPSWGIDPGVNFGLTVIEENKLWVFHGSLISDPTPGRQGLIAFKFLSDMLGAFSHHGARMAIEGAAYGAPFRQVELSEIRTAFYLVGAIFHPFFGNVIIKPPATIRKKVFGNGKTQAGDEWPTLNHNAADALSMALYAAQMEDYDD
jgi:hypothetical protein